MPRRDPDDPTVRLAGYIEVLYSEVLNQNDFTNYVVNEILMSRVSTSKQF